MIAVHDRALPEGWFSYPDINDHDVLRPRIESNLVLGPCWFRLQYLDAYAEAASGWLHAEAEVIAPRG